MTCEHCRATFEPRPRKPNRFCSQECHYASRRVVRTCGACGLEFSTRHSEKRKACSVRCASALRSGPGNHRFNGGLSTFDGYVVCVHRNSTRWTLYHRALMEAHIGRPLRADEIVHHVNGVRDDNRIENLEVMTRSEHIAIHRQDLIDGRRRALKDAA